MNTIEQFRDEYSWLSNFSPCDIIYEGISYPSTEHFYVGMKTTDILLREEISKLETPGKAKRFGRKIDVRDDWDDIKISTMRYALDQKFSKDPYKTLLIETGDMEIQEGNFWQDKFWGVDFETKEGKNILGKMIMKIRDSLTLE